MRRLGSALDADRLTALKPVAAAAGVGLIVGVSIGLALSVKLGAPQAEVKV